MAGAENDEDDLARAKAALVQIVARLQAAQRDELRAVLDEQYAARTPTAEASGPGETRLDLGRLAWWLMLIAVLCGVAVAAARYLPPQPTFVSAGTQLQPNVPLLLAFLALVVALASYLASVGREIIKHLGAQTLTVDERGRARANLFCLSAAEAVLVILGVLATLRLLEPSLLRWLPVEPDALLWSLLGVVLIYLALLHLRTWIVYRPWKG